MGAPTRRLCSQVRRSPSCHFAGLWCSMCAKFFGFYADDWMLGRDGWCRLFDEVFPLLSWLLPALRVQGQGKIMAVGIPFDLTFLMIQFPSEGHWWLFALSMCVVQKKTFSLNDLFARWKMKHYFVTCQTTMSESIPESHYRFAWISMGRSWFLSLGIGEEIPIQHKLYPGLPWFQSHPWIFSLCTAGFFFTIVGISQH